MVVRPLGFRGAVAQLGERYVRNVEVGSSILLGSTNYLLSLLFEFDLLLELSIERRPDAGS